MRGISQLTDRVAPNQKLSLNPLQLTQLIRPCLNSTSILHTYVLMWIAIHICAWLATRISKIYFQNTLPFDLTSIVRKSLTWQSKYTQAYNCLFVGHHAPGGIYAVSFRRTTARSTFDVSALSVLLISRTFDDISRHAIHVHIVVASSSFILRHLVWKRWPHKQQYASLSPATLLFQCSFGSCSLVCTLQGHLQPQTGSGGSGY